jgi:hypothetical protein
MVKVLFYVAIAVAVIYSMIVHKKAPLKKWDYNAREKLDHFLGQSKMENAV